MFSCTLRCGCLVIVVWLFLTTPRVYLQFVIVVFPDHTHLLFSSFAIILMGKRELVDLLCLSCDCCCSVALPDGAMGWSAVCDCGISRSYSLALLTKFF